MLAYFNGQFMPPEDIRISPDDRGFLFADGVYEVVRSYHGKLFQLEGHLARLRRSLQAIQIHGVDVEGLGGVAEQLLERNGLQAADGTVYFQITRGVAPRKHAFPAKGTRPTVYLSAAALPVPEDKLARGVHAILVPDIRWARCDVKSVALLPNVLANEQARAQGAEEALFVRDGVVTEGSHSNFAAVFDGELVTHPKTNYILAGITREIVLELCETSGIPVRESPIFEQDLERAEEAMVLGTTTEVMPIVAIGSRRVGNGTPGPLTRKLQDAFRELIAAPA